MAAAANRLDADIIRLLAEHYARLPHGLTEPTAEAVPSGVAAGKEPGAATAGDPDEAARLIVANGMPEADLPACSKCHSAGKRADYPILAGQKPEYLAARLRLWRGDPNVVDARKSNESMPTIARRIPEEMIEPLARYFGTR
jgi:cytochrome c553